MEPLRTPDIEARFHQPDGWQSREMIRAGRHVRYGFVFPKNPKALLVCLPGLSEFCEKYFELAHEALTKNYGVICLDWAGQGLSIRFLPNPLRRHSQGYDADLEDLEQLLTGELPSVLSEAGISGDLPKLMMAHSMGAHLGLRYMLRHKDAFKAACLSAPMMSLSVFKFLPDTLTRLLTGAFNIIMGGSPIITLKDWREDKTLDHTSNPFSTDPVRYLIHPAWSDLNPALQSGFPTHGWLHEAVISSQKLKRDLTKSPLEVPCVIGLSEQDEFVDNDSIRSALKFMPNATLKTYEKARHELFMERDEVRNELLGAFWLMAEKNLK